MPKVKEKKVELIELFYDLIYVYAISQMTLIVEEPDHGILTHEMFGVYIIASMVIIQAWLYMTEYVNRYGSWRWYEYVLVSFNMGAVIVVANTLTYNLDNSTGFIIAMLGVLGSVAALYIIQIYKEKQDITAAWHTLDILILIITIYMIALVINLAGYSETSIMVIITAIILGMMLPFVKKGKYDLRIVSMPHLVERLELITIVTFGEAIVGITGFFVPNELGTAAPMVLMIILFMFGSYVAQVHFLCNHHQIAKPTRMTWSHYQIVIAINLVTVALLYFKSEEAEHMFTAGLMMMSILAFYLALHATSKYYCEDFPHSLKDVAMSVAVVAIGALVVFGFPDSPYGFLIGSLIATGGNFYLFWYKYSSNRCINPLHHI
ncbi:MAG: low temperature requirement protein A [Thermoplasmata archaeon]|nr:low temperature requirement protein A [Thermoplasmata archaeon]WII08103.1 low temperature requirement protein A [Methanomassiliicoccales archaeon LGM-RCC1]